MRMVIKFAPDWITAGYGHDPDGQWIELGQAGSVKCTPPPRPPELGLHDVADKLNALERAGTHWLPFNPADPETWPKEPDVYLVWRCERWTSLFWFGAPTCGWHKVTHYAIVTPPGAAEGAGDGR